MFLVRVRVRVCAAHKVCFISSWIARKKAIKEEDGGGRRPDWLNGLPTVLH